MFPTVPLGETKLVSGRNFSRFSRLIPQAFPASRRCSCFSLIQRFRDFFTAYALLGCSRSFELFGSFKKGKDRRQKIRQARACKIPFSTIYFYRRPGGDIRWPYFFLGRERGGRGGSGTRALPKLDRGMLDARASIIIGHARWKRFFLSRLIHSTLLRNALYERGKSISTLLLHPFCAAAIHYPASTVDRNKE